MSIIDNTVKILEEEAKICIDNASTYLMIFIIKLLMTKSFIHALVAFKQKHHIRMYAIEYIVVAIILLASALIGHKGRIERVGVIAVFLTFCHASVADRLEEAERRRMQQEGWHQNPYAVKCYHKISKYYYAKEACRTVYFIALGAWSALVGVILFLLYPYWRKVYRKYHPLER